MSKEIEWMDLSGVWEFSMAQYPEGVMPRAFNDTITLPGTTSLAQKGVPNPKYETGFLTDTYAFEGQAWYHRVICLPPESVGKTMILTLERTRRTTLFVDGESVGSCDSLCTPHMYDITKYVTKRRVEITICVENTNYPTAGGHLTSRDTQSNWNGITGKIALGIFPAVFVRNVQAYPDVAGRCVTLKMELFGAQEADFSVTGTITRVTKSAPAAREFGIEEIAYDTESVPEFQETIVAGEDGTVSVTIPLGEKPALWDEYTPSVYTLSYTVNGGAAGKVSFGLREFRAEGSRFTMNGKPTMLRGKHDALLFPKTGYAPTDVKSWLRVFATIQQYGINHYRFHTCCPPEAAFIAADLLGVYLSPELPFWGTMAAPGEEGYHESEQNYLISLGEKMLDSFGNHPSFLMLSLGNELWGSPARLSEIITRFRARDGRHLYTQGSNNFQHFPLILPEEDYFVGVRLSHERLIRGGFGNCDLPLGHIQGERPSTTHTYDEAIFPQVPASEGAEDIREIEIQYGTGVKKVRVDSNTDTLIPDKPIVSHEIGEYEVFPNFDEIEKYTGTLKARNFEVIAQRMKEKHIYHQWKDFFLCSGKLAAACYKEELEAAMRSQYIAGFQILDLQDFSGQGTALVGMLDAFLENKGLVTPETWRESCNDCVVMAKFPHYVFRGGEAFSAEIVCRCTRPNLPQLCDFHWTLAFSDGTVLAEGKSLAEIRADEVISCGKIEVALPQRDRAAEMKLTLESTALGVENHYDLMLYPEIAPVSLASRETLLITADIAEANAALSAGKNVFFLPAEIANSIPGFYCTDFWCYPMFRDICISMGKPVAVGTMGLCIDENHPALAEFPAKHWSTPQWYDIVTHANAAILDDTAETLTPIVQVIDNFDRCHKLGIVFEARVGKGNLLVCTSRLSEIADRDEVKWFAQSLIAYAESDAFQPKGKMTLETFREIFS